ncbi:helix-turn-helix domain-containing protein [Streptomyces beijiangensis]|uniref:Helix-turn-helix domain-containing protein n=1 Tax=Streptomyces beijiangensis TaxID=163361 RepID=A0A939F7X7_9ACTN|nr:helix-turn-helix domain-containing protein [Streptomyces beijiangensis]MBO0513985.1 helix-turn-helix domain-containing protein [Streptomyces beijiangensis]
MTEQQLSAPSRARSERSRSGIGHVDQQQSERFTVVGNHLAQHAELSLTAIGLATHIQSLPEGAPVGIKVLAAKFPEGEIRIAAALRELEAHGYLARARERMPSGRIVTRTTSYNVPLVGGVMEAEPVPTPEPVPERGDTAQELLASLRAHEPRLLLSVRDTHHLAPAVSAWLERGIAPDAVRRTLTAGLPAEPLRRPAAFLAHRLAELLPPLVPAAPEPSRPDPFQTCDGCERAYRAPRPGRCRDCAPLTAVA